MDIQSFKPIGASSVATVGSSASAPLGAIPAKANAVMLQTRTADIWYTLDGTTPSATNGFLMVHDAAPIIIPLDRATDFRAIRTASTNAPLLFQMLQVKSRFF